VAAAAIFLSCCELLQTPKGLLHHIKGKGFWRSVTGRARRLQSFITSHLSSHWIRDITADRKRKDYYDSLE